MPVLTGKEREQFMYQGFVKLDNAFPRELADEAREILWQHVGFDPHDRSTWTRPVVRLGDFPQRPFRRAVNTERLHDAFDELVGVGRWIPRASLGTFVVRFPHPDDPGDTGWHLDASFPPDPATPPASYMDWRINLRSRGRALLMLFLFSDIGDDDAPTRIRIGSHLRVPRLLAPAGEEGISMLDISKRMQDATSDLPETNATGPAGTVYLCHPFLLHAGQPHRGQTPRFLAQPPLVPNGPVQLDRPDASGSPVEQAIRLALHD